MRQRITFSSSLQSSTIDIVNVFSGDVVDQITKSQVDNTGAEYFWDETGGALWFSNNADAHFRWQSEPLSATSDCFDANPAHIIHDVLTADPDDGGLGVSGPQIVEGWYGEPWGKPYWRLRDYIQIMRKVNRREDPVTHDGREYQLPYTGPGAMGIGKPLMSILHTNRDLPIWLGSPRPAYTTR